MRKQRMASPSPELQRQMTDDYQSGMNTIQIGAKYNYSAVTVAKYIREMGMEIRSRSELNRRRGTTIDLNQLRELIDRKLSTTEIARAMGLSQPTIEMKLRRLGWKSQHGRGSKLTKNYFWNGGRRVTEDGYIYVKQNDHPFATKSGYVLEHRLVMEEQLGRYLRPEEVVHHKDKNRQNNHPDNLLVFESNAAHLRYELTGVTPNYTREGLQRMRENAQRLNRRRYESSLRESGIYADQSPPQTGHPPSSLDTTIPCP